MYKAVVFAALVAVANAGLLGAPIAAPVAYSAGIASPLAYSAGIASPALVSQQSNILRTPGNLGQVSTYSKTINTPYSSVSKSDVRVSNDALAYGAVAPALSYGAVAAPALSYGAVASPALSYAASPLAARVGVAPVGLAGAPLGVAYSAAPVVSHVTLDGFGAHIAY